MTFTRRHIIGFLALTGTVFAAPAYAAPHKHTAHSLRGHDAPRAQFEMRGMGYAKYAQKTISPSKAKSIAAKRVPGAKFVDISRSGDRYRVRMLAKDGRVVDVLIDAATGRVLN